MDSATQTRKEFRMKREHVQMPWWEDAFLIVVYFAILAVLWIETLAKNCVCSGRRVSFEQAAEEFLA
jgi:hypothetical protein